MKKLKFHKQFNKPILEGRKTQTARIALNDLAVGDQVAAINSEKHSPFAVLEITSTVGNIWTCRRKARRL